jgi:hypothetical protein
LEDLMAFGECKEAYNLYREHYLQDPMHGDEQLNASAPPVDRLFVIYGINLPTETLYFFRPSEKAARITALELDPDVCVCVCVCVSYFWTNLVRSVADDSTPPSRHM